MVQRHLSQKPNDCSADAEVGRTELFPRHSPRLKTRNYLLVDGEKERERKDKGLRFLAQWVVGAKKW